jgi:hypothetical protein
MKAQGKKTGKRKQLFVTKKVQNQKNEKLRFGLSSLEGLQPAEALLCQKCSTCDSDRSFSNQASGRLQQTPTSQSTDEFGPNSEFVIMIARLERKVFSRGFATIALKKFGRAADVLEYVSYPFFLVYCSNAPF